MTKQNIKLALSAIAISLSLLARPAYADMCTTQYGGSQECKPSDLTINKQVKYPIERTVNPFVENLTTTDRAFAPGDEITYRLIIKNNSGETFNPVNIKDILPPYLTFVAGSPGTFEFDSTNHWVTFKLDNLIAGETRSFDLRFRVTDANTFPSGKTFFCVTNVAEVRSINRFDSDSAQACLGSGNTLGITTLPVAGFSDLAILLPFAGVALGGFALLRKNK